MDVTGSKGQNGESRLCRAQFTPIVGKCRLIPHLSPRLIARRLCVLLGALWCYGLR